MMSLDDMTAFKNQKHYTALETISRFMGQECFFFAGWYLITDQTNLDTRFPIIIIPPVIQMKVYVWPDGFWCYPDELEMFQHRSDDYQTIDVPEDIEDVYAWLSEWGFWT